MVTKWCENALKIHNKGEFAHGFTMKPWRYLTRKGGTDVASFTNNYKHTIDAKNRLFIPARFRAMLGESFYLYYEPGSPCIAVFSEEEWEKKSNEVVESRDADWQRYFFSNVITVEPDKQGRVTVKPDFCKGAGLKKDVAVVGVGNRVEIWDADKYEAEHAQLEATSKRFPSMVN